MPNYARYIIDQVTPTLSDERIDLSFTAGECVRTGSLSLHQSIRLEKELAAINRELMSAKANLGCMEHCTKPR